MQHKYSNKCCVFRALINSLVRWFSTGSCLDLVLFQIYYLDHLKRKKRKKKEKKEKKKKGGGGGEEEKEKKKKGWCVCVWGGGGYVERFWQLNVQKCSKTHPLVIQTAPCPGYVGHVPRQFASFVIKTLKLQLSEWKE